MQAFSARPLWTRSTKALPDTVRYDNLQIEITRFIAINSNDYYSQQYCSYRCPLTTDGRAGRADARDARRIVDQLGDRVEFFKVGLELFTGTGLEFVRELQSRNKQIFLDLKVFDIGETVKRTVKVVVDAGVSFLTIHGNSGNHHGGG